MTVHKVYKGPCELEMKSHVNAPIKDLPILETLDGYHVNAEFTVRKCEVIHDYLEENKK